MAQVLGTKGLEPLSCLPLVGHCASSCCRREEERTSHSPPAKSLSCCELQLPFGKSSSVLLVFYAELLMMGHVLCSSVLTLGERVRCQSKIAIAGQVAEKTRSSECWSGPTVAQQEFLVPSSLAQHTCSEKRQHVT